MDNKYRKILVLGASFDTKNMGVNALTFSIVQAIVHYNKNCEIFLLDYSEKKKTYEVKINETVNNIKLINMRFSKKVLLKNNIPILILLSAIVKIIPVKKVKKFLISKNIIINQIVDADLAVAISAGDSFSDIYGVRRFIYTFLPMVLVILNNIKLVLLPQTIGPFKSKMIEKLSKIILNKVKIIYTRDHECHYYLQKILKENKKVKFNYDMAFILKSVKPRDRYENNDIWRWDENEPFIGFNISGLLYMGGYTRKNMFELNIDYKNFVFDLINHIIDTYEYMIKLVPHVFGDQRHAESDVMACNDVFNRIDNKRKTKVGIIRNNYDQNEIKYIIQKSTVFIGSRMHSCIAALSQNVPAVAISYSEKFKGVYKTIGMEKLVADPKEHTKMEIYDIIDYAIRNENNIKSELTKIMPSIKQKVENIFYDIQKYTVNNSEKL